MRSILLIDDDETLLGELAGGLAERLSNETVEIRAWIPGKEEKDARTAFEQRVDAETTLVVTDYDLTSHGQTGLFGSSIVAWCQARAIPVGDFSRATGGALPKEPDLFEFRVPTDTATAVAFVASVFKGFRAINEALTTRPELLAKRSPAAVLAAILGAPEDENQFTLYGVRFGTTIGVLMDAVIRTAPEGQEPAPEQKVVLLSYIVGHLLLNAVLRFPGPILSPAAFKAYVASDEADAANVLELFQSAIYTGPFSDVEEPFLWLTKLDSILDALVKELPAGTTTETSGELHRLAIEAKLSRTVSRHGCSRCGGSNGGFYCPFTKRTVCQRADCSVGSSSWIPQGAKVCRIERDFFDEWAPILGL